MFVQFLNKLQDAIDSLEECIVVSSAIDELLNEQQLYETSEKESFEGLKNPHHRLLSYLDQIDDFQYKFFSQFTVLETITMAHIKFKPLFLRKLY